MQLPFAIEDLTAKENWSLELYPKNQHWLAAMRDRDSVHPEDSKPLQKLMSAMVSLDSDDNFGLSLPRKCCIYVAEANAIRELEIGRNKAILNYAKLCDRIAKSLEKSVAEVQQLMRNPFQHLDVLGPWMDEVTVTLSSLQATDTNFATVTVMIQHRLISSWSEHDTLSLPEALFNYLLDYAMNEQRGWEDSPEDEVIIEEESFEIESDSQSSKKAIAASTSSD